MKTISEHVLDIAQNSVRAKATLIEIIVNEDKTNDLYSLIINDNGCGMNSEVLKQATNPFFTSRTTRKVGLGLSLLKQNAENAGGSFSVDSEAGKGTTVKAVFRHSNIDRPPLGDIWNTWYFTLLSNLNIRLIYEHKTNFGNFEIDSKEVLEMLQGVSLQQKEIKEAVIGLIINNLRDIKVVK
jgi:anti-sigma regulatory factor (Ser/Thr protein kinase)